MTTQEWENLHDTNYDEYVQKYKEFMYTPSNSGHCLECPKNVNWNDSRTMPCGQFSCWVDCHCRRE